MASAVLKPAFENISKVSSRPISGAGTASFESGPVASIRPGLKGIRCPPQTFSDITDPMATISATMYPRSQLLSTMQPCSSEEPLTRDMLIYERSPKQKAVVERRAIIIGSKRLPAYARIHAPSARRDISRCEIMEANTYPLGGGSSPGVQRGVPELRHVSGARRDGGREVRGVGSPVVNQDVLEKRGLRVWIVEGRDAMVGEQADCHKGRTLDSGGERHLANGISIVI